MWATVSNFREHDTLMLVYSDFLNDILKGPTHLMFFYSTCKVISQIIHGDRPLQGKNGYQTRKMNLNGHHIKIERLIEVVQKLFTPSTLLQLFEESMAKKHREDEQKKH